MFNNKVILLRTLDELKRTRASIKTSDIGLVPTMGNLHAGHISLLERALIDHEIVFVTIFVNPKQFGPQEDYKKYPRTLERDLELIQKTSDKRTVFVFAPQSAEEVFPVNFSTTIALGSITKKLCGQFRPGHFDGVTTVVYRLFSLIKPNAGYFGLKDYQQYIIIKKMVQDMELDIEIIGLPTIREQDGLALSSRNQYLSIEERKGATVLFSTLQKASVLLKNNPYKEALIKLEELKKETTAKWDYLEAVDAETLHDIDLKTTTIVVAGALRIGTTRLIDNLLIKIGSEVTK